MTATLHQAPPPAERLMCRGLMGLSNAHDREVVCQLVSTPASELEVDAFAAKLTNGEMAVLRQALVGVYLTAAKRRATTKAKKSELTAARNARSSIGKAARQVRMARPAERRGLHESFGLAPADRDGKFELGPLSAICWQVEYELSRIFETLDRAIEVESEKQTKRGERKARLRTLVEALAEWWESIGKRLTIIVDASKRDPWRGKKQKSVVHSRGGEFLDLAKAIFSKVDIFKQSEVQATADTVYKARLKKLREPSQR